MKLLPMIPLAALVCAATSAYAQSAQSQTPLYVASPGFPANGDVPAEFTCEGKDASPPIAWAAGPAGTQSFALVLEDLDAPLTTQGTTRPFVHWIVYDLSPTTTSIGEHARDLPPGAAQGLNDFGKPGYGGPCPPRGRHHYALHLYALDTRIAQPPTPMKITELESAMRGHVLASGELTGSYQKRSSK